MKKLKEEIEMINRDSIHFTFYSYNDLSMQMKTYLKRSNNIPMQVLNWMTSIKK